MIKLLENRIGLKMPRSNSKRTTVTLRMHLRELAKRSEMNIGKLAGQKLSKIALMIMKTRDGGSLHRELPSIFRKNLEIAKAAMITDFTAFEHFPPGLQAQIQSRENRTFLESCIDIDRYAIHYFNPADITIEYLEHLDRRFKGTLKRFSEGSLDEQMAWSESEEIEAEHTKNAKENKTPFPI